MVNIVVCIITYDRPNLLKNTLESLFLMELSKDINLTICVIDNFKDETSRELVSKYIAKSGLKVDYITEKIKGITYARNSALEYAQDNDYDYIAFIDDDDTADVKWLDELYNSIKDYNADIVKGSINYSFEKGKEYLKYLDIFSNINAETGSKISTAWSNNVIFSVKCIRDSNIRFDHRFDKIGGSDSHFFKQLYEKDYKMFYCKEAIINSNIEGKRTGFYWLARRNLRVGANISISDKILYGKKKALKIFSSSLRESFKYFLNLTKLVYREKYPILSPVMYIFFIIGRISGLLGFAPKEYK